MQNSWGKFGELLKDALEKGKLPPSSPSFSSSSSSSKKQVERVVPASLNPCFAVLGLPVNASFQECKKAYKQKLKTLHPDTKKTASTKEEDTAEGKDALELQDVLESYEKIRNWFSSL